MKKNENSFISHKGIVTGKTPDKIKIEIRQYSSCVHCQVKGMCSFSEWRDRTIDAIGDENFEIGEEVLVRMEESIGWTVIAYAFLFPVIFMLLALFFIKAKTGNELFGALGGLGILFPYYAGLYLLKNKLHKKIIFQALRIENL
jgi:sigma-E factor negative regulatory protein RseC